MTDFENAARATAEWWADKVFGSAVARTTSSDEDRYYRDRGDSDAAQYGATTFALHALAKSRNPAPQDKRGEYVEAVTGRIRQMMESAAERTPDRPYVAIFTDYGAPFEFHEIDERLGISSVRYPSKSMSNTRPDHVTVQFGYGAGDEVIWHEEGWEPPVCGQDQWDLTTPRGGRLPFRCSAPMYHDLNQHVFDTPSPLCVGPDPYHGEEVCNRPADDYHHATGNPDAYMDRWSHEFQPSPESAGDVT